MSTARALSTISEEDYLAGEEAAAVKHEYVAGRVYAMTGARTAHNVISGNVFASFHAQLRGSPCRPFSLDMKLRIEQGSNVRHYYPDVFVACEPEPPDALFQQQPVVVVEVLSDSTRRTDEGEKKDAYLDLASLSHYLLLEQDSVGAVVYYRAGDHFESLEYAGLDDTIELEGIGLKLSLRDAYENAL